MIPNYVVIPFKDQPELTCSLVNQLLAQGECEAILLFDNGSKPETLEWLEVNISESSGGREKVEILSRPEAGIYSMWNEGWLMALERSGDTPVNIAILNNDIVIPPAFMSTLGSFLREDDKTWVVYPDYDRAILQGVAETLSGRVTRGTYQHGGMSGWAFMLKGESIHEGMSLVDEQFEWWYGDDDIVRNVEACGKKVKRVVGLPLDHVHEATARDGSNEWTHDAKNRDTERFHRKWS